MSIQVDQLKRPKLDLDINNPPKSLTSLDEAKSSHDVGKQEQSTTLGDSTPYQSTCFNRNSSSIAKYTNRILDDFPTPSERYYDIRVVKSEGKRNYFGDVGDQCIMFHSNRVCVLTIAPTHPVIANDLTIERIEHTFEGKDDVIDRAQNKPQGKAKRGTQKVQKNSPICALICSDGSKYIVTGSITSRLIEINPNIVTKPNLVKEKPLSDGYIAILQPNDWKRMDEVRLSLPKLD